jgi:glycine hydroxymethyltransferase
MDLSHWWHLTHWAPVTFLSKVFNFIRYKTLPNWEIDFDQVKKLAHQHKPKIILAWFSAYPRELDYDKFAEIAKEVGAVAFADVSHIWWFIATWVLKNPLDHGFHVMMTTTHKSLRWPRWALILSKWIVSNPLKKPENTIENIPTRIDRAVFPWIQWWPHINTISAIAVALLEAQTDKFKEYATQALKNSKVMAEEFINRWYKLVTWWTDNHMIVVDFSNTPVENWKNAEHILDLVGISTSKSTIPDDPNPPFRPSGLRIWTPAMTTRWVKEDDIRKIVDFIDQALKLIPLMEEVDFHSKIEQLRKQVIDFSKQFPVPGIS